MVIDENPGIINITTLLFMLGGILLSWVVLVVYRVLGTTTFMRRKSTVKFVD